jgi:putative Holliday junction resolvase
MVARPAQSFSLPSPQDKTHFAQWDSLSRLEVEAVPEIDGEDLTEESRRILAIDYGRRRIGLAISDPTGTIATGLATLEVRGVSDAIERIAVLRGELAYNRIVIGLPLRTSGEPGEMADEVISFAEKLRAATGVPVETIDERFTSTEALRMLHQTGRKVKGNKGHIDRLAAEVLLRHYLETMAKKATLPHEPEGTPGE